mmetsp:Transcript_53658/g.104913  ORF Transcript_53658/g.104913 Transcript_53658/m.104913 type:complete len:139 (-) Transcript_53658:172-588(-)
MLPPGLVLHLFFPSLFFGYFLHLTASAALLDRLLSSSSPSSSIFPLLLPWPHLLMLQLDCTHSPGFKHVPPLFLFVSRRRNHQRTSTSNHQAGQEFERKNSIKTTEQDLSVQRAIQLFSQHKKPTSQISKHSFIYSST